MRRMLTLAVVAILLALSAQVVGAHGYIVRALPENRARLQHPPAKLQYWFSEALEPNFSTITLRDQSGAALAEGAVDANNTSLLSLTVPSDLPDGAYIVDLRPAFASDGHVVAESRVFFVGDTAEELSGSAGDYSVVPLEVFWRILMYTATVLLMGSFTLYAQVLVPAWGSAAFPAGLLPTRVMRRLTIIVVLALGLAFAANLIAIVQQSMVFFNTDPAEVIGQGLWQVVRIGSRFGDMWSIRMVLLALVALSLGLAYRWRIEHPETVRAFWTANVWLMALLIGGFGVTSHAAGSLTWPWIAMLVNWGHTLAVAVWIGGLMTLALVLPVALRPYASDARRHALLAALRRFSRLVVIALAVIITTGIYNASNWLYQPSDLTQTGWGMALLLKLALFASALVLGGMHFLASNPERFTRWQQLRERLPAIMRTLPLEALLALVTLMSVALLSASAVPEPVALTQPVDSPDATQIIGDLRMTVSISPGGPGVNSINAVLRQDNAAVNDADIRLQIVAPALGRRIERAEMPFSGDGLYVTAGDEIDSAGEWWTLFDVSLPGDDPSQRIAFAWDIRSEASIATDLSPRPLQVLALLGVVAALAFAAYPLARRLYRWLDWRQASVTTAAAAIAVTVFFMILGIQMVNQSEQTYEARFEATPARVNPILPDAGSLAEGQRLYLAHCSVWAEQPDELRSRLSGSRDEDLYSLTLEGWRDLPPCSGDLSETQRWHIVNFIRSLEEE